jgi:hypothetical protein
MSLVLVTEAPVIETFSSLILLEPRFEFYVNEKATSISRPVCWNIVKCQGIININSTQFYHTDLALNAAPG